MAWAVDAVAVKATATDDAWRSAAVLRAVQTARRSARKHEADSESAHLCHWRTAAEAAAVASGRRLTSSQQRDSREQQLLIVCYTQCRSRHKCSCGVEKPHTVVPSVVHSLSCLRLSPAILCCPAAHYFIHSTAGGQAQQSDGVQANCVRPPSAHLSFLWRLACNSLCPTTAAAQT